MTLRVLLSCPQFQRHVGPYVERLAQLGIEADVPPMVQQLGEEELVGMIGRYDGMIAGDDEVTRRVLEAGTRLKVVSKWGVGTDNIDKAAAAELGIRVTNTPGVFAGEVADVNIGYLVMLARGLHRTDAGARAGGWPKIEGFSLAERTLGIVGLGAIGLALGVRAAAMGMHVVGTDVSSAQQDAAAEVGIRVAALDAVIRESDLLSLCCPLTAENRHMINAESLATMKPGSYLVNAARGPLVDEAALVDALRSGHLAGAALDVFEIEPLPADSPLRGFDSVILGTHNASNTLDAVLRVNEMAFDNLLMGLGVTPA
jgi:D-3-phosphoglycerate dehydrogenase